MRKEELRIEAKSGHTWQHLRTVTEPEEIFRSLAHDLTAKHLHHAPYVRRICDKCNYDGTRTITVYYSDDVRRVFIVND